jgi:hypothetical protein
MDKPDWSYLPRYVVDPSDEEVGCGCCGVELTSCLCPECPTCGATGDPRCYWEHGLVMPPGEYVGEAIRVRVIRPD